MDPYQALANAIVEMAAKDYAVALKYHYAHPHLGEYADEVKTMERFFRSGWFGMLTNLDGEYLMREIRCMVHKEVAA